MSKVRGARVFQSMRYRVLSLASALLVCAISVSIGACDDPTTTSLCESAGICDPPPPPDPNEYVVVADASPGSVASVATLGPIFDAILAHAIARPGSTIAVRVVGEDEEHSPEIAAVVVPEPPRRLRSPERHREETAARLRTELLERVTPMLEASADQRASAIAAALTLAGRAPPRAPRRFLVVASDLRERSRPWLDLETRMRLPTEAAFARLLERRGLLQPGTFRSTDRVIVLDLGLPALPSCRRCPAGIRRADELRALWTPALARAGAGAVELQGPVPAFDALDPSGAITSEEE